MFSSKRYLVSISVSLLSFSFAGGAHAQDTLNMRLDKAESILLGRVSPPDQTVDSRLEALELNLYGKAKHGHVAKRIDAISQFLGIKEGQDAKAPIGGTSSSSADSPSAIKSDSPDSLGKGNDSETANSAQTQSPIGSSDSSNSSAGNDVTKASSANVPAWLQDAGTGKSGTADSFSKPAAASSTGKTAAASDTGKPAAASNTGKTTATCNTIKAVAASDTSKTAATSKNAIAPLKMQEAKMATASAAGAAKTNSNSASKLNETMPPAAPSLGKAVNPNLSAQAKELLREGIRQNTRGQYREAEITFRRVLTVDPRNADAFYNLGSLAERNHDYVMALTNYRAALNFNSKDKDYIAAVNAMEAQLSASAKSDANKSRNLDVTSPTLLNQNTVKVGNFRVPVDADAAPPNLSVSSGQPFQLSGSKNDVIMNTTQFNNQYAPTMNVNQQAPPPTMGVAQRPPKKNGTLGKVMGVGVRTALYSSGLHCPICRMMGGGFHF